jgi:glycyl-tRNA synthetase
MTYGGLSGFQDYGILGTKLKLKFLNIWRDMFCTNNVVEIDTPNIMPHDVLKASGHVDRFTDFVVHDKNNICYRADHLVKLWFANNNMHSMIDKVDGMDQQMLEYTINKHKMLPFPVNPNTNIQMPLKVERKNLMFDVTNDFLRPELAQGIFVNFKACQQFLQREPPFGIAQIGKSYRKEISPSQYTRMREFNQAELEYFVDPLNKTHPDFKQYRDLEIPLLTAEMQNKQIDTIKITLEDALNSKLISHELMACFLGKIYTFALRIGLKEDKIRFRQHLSNEMAHYASECWDLESLVNGDWLECIGCADRGSYDLQAHSIHGNVSSKCKRVLQTPIVSQVYKAKLDMKLIGQRHKELSAKILDHFNGLSQSQLRDTKSVMFNDGDNMYVCIEDQICVLTKDMLQINEGTMKITTEEYYPHVLEPSFGIDRLIYSVFEQNFWSRENDNQRIVLSIPKCLVPYDIAIFSLSKNDTLWPKVEEINNSLIIRGFFCHTDNSNTAIGKRYSRADEMGIPYVITVDFNTLKDNHVTIRERDSMKQIRVPVDKICESLIQFDDCLDI